MLRGAIQFQAILALSEFQRLYGTEEQGEAALEQARRRQRRYGLATAQQDPARHD
jgi:hypothetical protein